MRSKRSEFSEPQKCLIFARDRATCCYTTNNLWRVDDGLTGHPLHIDHVVPCSKGGTNELENGVCAEFVHNLKKRANSGEPLLRNGEPTPAFLARYGSIPSELRTRLERLSRVGPGDFFFNAALANLQWLATMPFWERVDGKPWGRTPEYWGRTILRLLEKWRDSSAPSLSSRNLLPPEPWSTDQALCIELIGATSASSITRIANKLTPMAEQNYQAERIAQELESSGEAKEFLKQLDENNWVTPQMKAILREQVNIAFPILPRPRSRKAHVA